MDNSYASALLRSLEDRSQELSRYLEDLRVANWGADANFRTSLKLYEWYADAIVRQAHFDWETAHAEDREIVIGNLLQAFLRKQRVVDHRLGRTGQLHVPKALTAIIRTELASLGLDTIEPVVTVGPPGSFDTQIVDLAHDLAENLHAPSIDLAVPRTAPRLGLISLPYLEGTRALWQPIVVGHELAHFLLAKNDERTLTLLCHEWIMDDAIGELDEADLLMLRETLADDAVDPVSDVRHVFLNWLTETLCDLNVVRRYGPAGIASFGEFLSPLRDGHAASVRHPPFALRLEAMFRYLDQAGDGVHASVAEPWRRHVGSTRWPEWRAAAIFISQLLLNREEEIWARVDSWGDDYPWRGRTSEVKWIAERLLLGLPGGTHKHDDGRTELCYQDVVTAAWVARQSIEHSSSVPIDRLAGKAIDVLRFVHSWEDAEESLRVTVEGVEKSHDNSETHDQSPAEEPERLTGGVQSGHSLKGLMRRTNDPLVVIPLLNGAIGDAGIDVRLSSSFIVFRHSSTAAFSALDRSHDPRTTQERVERDWGDGFVLHPGELVLAATMEYIAIPHDLSAQVVTRSSYGRLGLITATAIQVQPSSIGCITLELVNLAQTPIRLTAGERIAQIVLHRVAGARPISPEAVPLATKYQYQIGPEFSRIFSDRDVEILLRMRERQQHRP